MFDAGQVLTLVASVVLSLGMLFGVVQLAIMFIKWLVEKVEKRKGDGVE